MFCTSDLVLAFFSDLQKTQTFFLGLRMGGLATVVLLSVYVCVWGAGRSEGGLVAEASAGTGSGTAATGRTGGRRGAPGVVGGRTGSGTTEPTASATGTTAHLVDLGGGIPQRR